MVPDGKSGARRYGCWAGNPLGRTEDRARCVETTYSRGYLDIVGHQCIRKRGHGLNGEFCKQHAKRHPAPLPSIQRMTIQDRKSDL